MLDTGLVAIFISKWTHSENGHIQRPGHTMAHLALQKCWLGNLFSGQVRRTVDGAALPRLV